MKIVETQTKKYLTSPNYNYYFDKQTGFMAQWGRTYDEDPQRAPAPVIADIEVVASCNGPGGKICNFCYKANIPGNKYMTFEEFKTIFHKLPRSLTQIAFGADADLSINPDIWKIMEYTRKNRIIPNITVADITRETARKLKEVCGAVAVSWYGHINDKNLCYNSVQYLIEVGMDQVNIHFVLSKDTFPYIDELINDIKNDKRLKKLNAVVFLSLKQKGRGKYFQGLSQEEFDEVIKKCMENDIPFGFDSCSAIKFLKSIQKLYPEKYEEFKEMTEPCESFSQSIYINEKGEVYPCSFMENEYWATDGFEKKKKSFNLLSNEIKDVRDFIEKVWNSKEAIEFSANCKVCNAMGEGCQYYQI